MPISFACSCGKTLRVPDAHAGRRARCPMCGAVVTVPAPEVDPDPVFEVVEDDWQVPPAQVPKPVPKSVDDDSDDATPYGLAPESRDSDDDTGGTGTDDAPRGRPRLPNFRKGRDNYT